MVSVEPSPTCPALFEPQAVAMFGLSVHAGSPAAFQRGANERWRSVGRRRSGFMG